MDKPKLNLEGACVGEPCWRNPDTGYIEYCENHEAQIADLVMELDAKRSRSEVANA